MRRHQCRISLHQCNAAKVYIVLPNIRTPQVIHQCFLTRNRRSMNANQVVILDVHVLLDVKVVCVSLEERCDRVRYI